MHKYLFLSFNGPTPLCTAILPLECLKDTLIFICAGVDNIHIHPLCLLISFSFYNRKVLAVLTTTYHDLLHLPPSLFHQPGNSRFVCSSFSPRGNEPQPHLSFKGSLLFYHSDACQNIASNLTGPDPLTSHWYWPSSKCIILSWVSVSFLKLWWSLLLLKVCAPDPSHFPESIQLSFPDIRSQLKKLTHPSTSTDAGWPAEFYEQFVACISFTKPSFLVGQKNIL